ncbi:unnamed protein product [Porites lobata]|uniref:Fibrinogen C-terminal domain-containing protein n=1 Tax=Porites lobata TaxID=104759 RepID=A0ABN8NTB8_9CNID|nr:unnamed protein product [Porites lobata]
MKHILALGVIFTASVANALYLADSDQGVNCDCPAHLKGQRKMHGGKWSLYRDYGDESHPGSSCKDIKDRKGEDSANGIYWIKLKGEDEAFQVYCDMDNGGWTMVFKAVTREENGYKLYTSAETSTEDVEDALDVTKKHPEHYKNRIVLNWEDFKPSEARVALYTSGELQKELKFNASGSNNSNWFSCSALTQSSWFDIPSEPHNYFSIYGSVHSTRDKRRFFINRNYRSCPNDAGWMVITELEHCDWEMNKKNAILYSKLSNYTNWNEDENVLEADVLVVYVR